MSLVPQVHFNFGPTSFDRFYQVLLPIIPGSVFVGKWLWNRPDLVPSIRDALGLSPYATLPVFAFITYVAGFVLFASSGIFTGIVSGVAQGLIFRRWVPLRSSAILSKCTNWRLVAGKFLDDLKPSTPEPQPPSTVMDKILKPMKDLTNKREEDALWEEWYRILQDYLLRDTPIISNDSFFISVAVEATGWAGLAALRGNGMEHHWTLYLLAIAFVLLGALSPFMATLGYLSNERLTYWDFTARLLAEMQNRKSASASTAQAPASDVKSPHA